MCFVKTTIQSTLSVGACFRWRETESVRALVPGWPARKRAGARELVRLTPAAGVSFLGRVVPTVVLWAPTSVDSVARARRVLFGAAAVWRRHAKKAQLAPPTQDWLWATPRSHKIATPARRRRSFAEQG